MSFNRIMILQPGYLPWLGFFDMFFKSDVLVYHTDIQYDKNSWRNRNRIKTRSGWNWLTVPVFIKGHSKDKIEDMKIDNSKKWINKHLNLIKDNYCKAPYFDKYFDKLSFLLRKKRIYLLDLNIELVDWLMEELGFSKPIMFSNELNLNGSKSTERLINICKELGTETYLSGSRGRNYICEHMFQEAGIHLEFHDYIHPVYKQQFEGFVPYLSVIDLLFNHGEKSLSILTGKNETQKKE